MAYDLLASTGQPPQDVKVGKFGQYWLIMLATMGPGMTSNNDDLRKRFGRT
jgi:hypothetical protein